MRRCGSARGRPGPAESGSGTVRPGQARGKRLRHGTAWPGSPPLTDGPSLAEAVVLEPAPFRHAVIPGFLAGPAFAEALRDELLGLGFRGRRNDLLSLWQVGPGPK